MNDDYGMERYEKTEIFRERFLEKQEEARALRTRIIAMREDLEKVQRDYEMACADARVLYKGLVDYMGIPDGSFHV